MGGHPMHSLFEAARAAMARCHTPYSHFPVGAALLTSDGRVFAGANMEVISYPEGWCAETSALAHFVMAGGGTITDIAVCAEKKDRITPCGGCRQRLAEFAGPDTRLHLCDQSGIVETVTIAEIFPRGFEAEALR
jgi:cytidine deaminase